MSEYVRRSPSDRVLRAGVTGVVIVMCAAAIAALTVPGAALVGRVLSAADAKYGGTVGGAVKLPPVAQRSIVLGADGSTIATLAGEQNREVVPLGSVPSHVREAVIAIEDSRFWEHHGVDLASLMRALLTNARSGRVEEGGSTITQQLVKNTLVGTERTVDRKIREAQYAVALEKTMTKNQILEMYLNEAYFSQGVYGVGAASEFYFGLHVSKISVVQAATLAGIIRSPENYDPIAKPKASLTRRNLVLDRMADLSYITRAAAEKSSKLPLGAKAHPLPKPVEPYFVEFVKQLILDDPTFGATRAERARALYQGGLRIATTLDVKLQKAASDAVAKVLNKPGDPAAALVAIDAKTGRVRSMVGGRDFTTAKFNLAVQGKRQAGSAFKPFTLVAALDAGVPPGLTFDTPSPIEIIDTNGQPWKVENYSHRGEGIMDMRKATENSVNSFYAQLIKRIGPDKTVAAAKKLGITSELKPYLSLALGTSSVSPYEMASAYATLANGGVRCRPYAIARVTNPQGDVLLRNDASCSRVLDSSVAAQADAILKAVIDRGTGRTNGQIGRPAAGKTGTTEDYADAWFVGFTPQFATVVWLGFPESTERKLHNIHGLPDVFGGSLPAMIWNRYMRAAHQGLAVESFPAPPQVTTVQVPNVVGQLVGPAKQALEAAGFSVTAKSVTSGMPAGTVLAQTPAAGATVEAGSLVTLQVSNGTGPTPEPSPTPTESTSPPASPDGKPSAEPGKQ